MTMPRVELAVDVAASLDEHLPNRLSFGPGLDGDQLLAEQVARHLGGLLGAFDELNSPLLEVSFDGSFATSAGVDLCLNHGQRAVELFEGVGGLVGRARHDAVGDRHLGVAEELLGLEFVNFHANAPPESRTVVRLERNDCLSAWSIAPSAD